MQPHFDLLSKSQFWNLFLMWQLNTPIQQICLNINGNCKMFPNLAGIGDAAIMPMLALLVDTRHVAVYGTVYAVAQLAVSLSYGLGELRLHL